MNADEMKKQAAWAALEYIKGDGIVGVGTGSTVNHFIDALATIKDRIEGAVSSCPFYRMSAKARSGQHRNICALRLHKVWHRCQP